MNKGEMIGQVFLHDEGAMKQFPTIISTAERLGYDVEVEVTRNSTTGHIHSFRVFANKEQK